MRKWRPSPPVFRVLELALGCTAAIAAARGLGLDNAVSAGIITILSIQDTKKETLRAAVERFAAFLLAVACAWVAFSALGYTVVAIGAYLLLFTSLCYALRLQASLPICTVLVSHFWLAGHMCWPLVGNEAALMVIGTGIGIALNLLLPRDTGAMHREQRQVERGLRGVLEAMARVLDGASSPDAVDAAMDALAADIDAAGRRADALQGNTLLGDASYYVRYVQMRRHQLAILLRMAASLHALAWLPPQAGPLAGLLRQIAESLHEYNDASALLAALDALRRGYRDGPLPQDRPTFEARATLYTILMDTEALLLIKRTFVLGG